MNGIVILTGLLVIAYFGSILVGGRTLRGFGLPSGTEFLLLGILLGPLVFGVISRSTLASFEPLTVIALAWVGLIVGIHYGMRGSERIPPRRIAIAIAFGLATAAVTVGVSGGAAYWLLDLRGHDLWALALGVGAVTSSTTRYAVQWVAERYRASGPLTTLLADVASADDIVPLALVGVAFAVGDTPSGLHIPWSSWTSFGSMLLVGGVLGATASALSDIEPRVNERWGILLGTSLLGMGAAMRLGQSAPTTMFAMGLTISLLSKRASALRSMLDQTERPIMLPALVIAGAHVSSPTAPGPLIVAALALGARVAVKLLLGSALRRSFAASNAKDKLGAALGLGLLPSGIVTITVALAFMLRFPGATGRLVLALATASGLVGELIGPAMLRRELNRAGELADGPTSTPSPVPRSTKAAPAPRKRRSRLAGASLAGASLERTLPPGEKPQ